MGPYEQGYQDILVKLGMGGGTPKVPAWMSRVKGQAPAKPMRKKKLPAGRNGLKGISKNIAQATTKKPLAVD